jgi:hypothetical protein
MLGGKYDARTAMPNGFKGAEASVRLLSLRSQRRAVGVRTSLGFGEVTLVEAGRFNKSAYKKVASNFELTPTS